jgi:hypothetical protein
MLLALWTINLEASGEVQEESSIKVISVHRIEKLISKKIGSILQEEEQFAAKDRKKNIVLALRIDNISDEEWSEASKRKEIYVTDDQNQYRPEITSVSYSTATKSSCYILVFVVPKTILKFKIVISDYSVPFEAKTEIAERLYRRELCK